MSGEVVGSWFGIPVVADPAHCGPPRLQSGDTEVDEPLRWEGDDS